MKTTLLKHLDAKAIAKRAKSKLRFIYDALLDLDVKSLPDDDAWFGLAIILEELINDIVMLQDFLVEIEDSGVN